MLFRYAARELHPSPTLLHQPPDNPVRGMVDAGDEGWMSKMIGYDLRWQAAQHTVEFDDLITVHVELYVPAEMRYAFR